MAKEIETRVLDIDKDAVVKTLEKLGATNRVATTLIIGQPGSGKTSLARAVPEVEARAKERGLTFLEASETPEHIREQLSKG